MKIEVWYDTSPEQDGSNMWLFSKPTSMLQTMVDLRKCQLEHGSKSINIELTHIEDGDV